MGKGLLSEHINLWVVIALLVICGMSIMAWALLHLRIMGAQ